MADRSTQRCTHHGWVSLVLKKGAGGDAVDDFEEVAPGVGPRAPQKTTHPPDPNEGDSVVEVSPPSSVVFRFAWNPESLPMSQAKGRV